MGGKGFIRLETSNGIRVSKIVFLIFRICINKYTFLKWSTRKYLPKFTMTQKVHFHAPKCTLNQKLNYMNPRGYNARKVISELYASYELQCIVSGR